MAKQYDILFRLLLLGDSGVGKTCMLRRFTEGEFDPSHISTIGKKRPGKFSLTLFQHLDVTLGTKRADAAVYRTQDGY